MKHLEIVLAMCLAFALILPAGCAYNATNGAYTSTAYIRVTPRTSVLDTNARNVAVYLDTLKESYVRLAKDQAVLARAVNEDVNRNGIKLDRIGKTSWFAGDLTGTISRLQEKLSVTAVKDTNLIRMSLSGPKPDELPQVVNAVADVLVHVAAERSKQRRATQQKALKVRRDEITGQISAKQKAIEQIRGKSEVPSMRENRAIIRLTLQSLTTEITQLKLVQGQAQAALEAQQGKKNLQAQVTALNERLQAVENQYKEESKTLRDLNARLAKIAKLEAEIERLQKSAGQVNTALLQFRVALGDLPLRIHARAERPTQRSP